jgi:magnesium chelatase subunit D
MRFPFSAVVGQDDAKLALQLAAVDPRIGGVLLRGQKGSAKTTLARGLAGLLAGGAPFVDLPLGATEDRVVGTLDLPAVLGEGVARLRPGLLGQVDGGVLYVDEINLLADHLVDTLLDVAVSGVNIVEREGISQRHPARFVLVGSMNPEEGELRPQLLDRFGLCVEVRSPADPADRVEAVRRRLSHDREDGDIPDAATAADATLAARLARARPPALPDDLVVAACRLAVAVGAEGLRADLALCRAAAARAGLEGRQAVTEDDLRRVAPMVLAHRARRSPFDPPALPPGVLDDALRRALGDPPGEPETGTETATETGSESGPDPGSPAPDEGRTRPMPLGAERHPSLGSPVRLVGDRGRMVGDVPAGSAPGLPIAAVASVREIARHRQEAAGAAAAGDAAHLRAAVRETKAGRLLILAVDLSGSMGAPARAEAATGTVLGLLSQAYQRRDQVALVGFRAQGAEVLLAPTTSVEVARNRLGGLATGGVTPLAAGLRTALELARRRSPAPAVPVLAVLTDGRATGAPQALDDALGAAGAIRAAGVRALVLDCETGTPRLGLARRLAEAMGAECVPVDDLDPAAITTIIRRATEAA